MFTVIDPQVDFTLLRLCGRFCRLAHIAQSTPPSLSSTPLQTFDMAVKPHVLLWTSLSMAGSKTARLEVWGLRSLALHACAAYIASISSSADVDNQHLNS